MKVFVTGANGQLGHDVVNELVARGHEAIASGSGKNTPGCRMIRLSVVHPIIQWIFVSGRM